MQLNMAPNRVPHGPALDNAIFMPEVIRDKQVVYFYLVGAMDVASVAEIAKLALYSLLMAVIAYHDEHGEPPRVYSVWDEAQVMIAKNIENVLAQARSHGLACILAHQSMSQLNPPGGVDLRELVMACTAVKQVFGVRDPWMLNYISNTSGTTKYFRRSYNVSAADAIAGTAGVHRDVRRPRRYVACQYRRIHRPAADIPGRIGRWPTPEPEPPVDQSQGWAQPVPRLVSRIH